MNSLLNAVKRLINFHNNNLTLENGDPAELVEAILELIEELPEYSITWANQQFMCLVYEG